MNPHAFLTRPAAPKSRRPARFRCAPWRILLPGVALCFCRAPAAPAGVSTYAITQDTYIDQRNNGTNYYDDDKIKLVVNSDDPGDGSVTRGLLALPTTLPTSLPASQIYSVKIWFCQTWNNDDGLPGETPYTRGVVMYPLTSSFNASTVTWQSCNGGQYDSTQPLAFTPAANIQEQANWYWWCSWDLKPLWNGSPCPNGLIMMLNPETAPPAAGSNATWVTKVFASSAYTSTTYPYNQYQPFVEIVQTDQWNDTNGNWTTTTNWLDGTPPNVVDAAAGFLGNATQNRTVTVNATVTVGTLLFDNSAHSYTLAGASTIKISDLSGNAGAITVNHGSHTISAPLEFDSNTTVTVANSGDTLTISGPIDGPASGIDTSLIKAGSGTLVLSGSNSYSGGTSVDGGLLVAENVSAIPAESLLSIGASGSVVLGNPAYVEPLGLPSGSAGPLDSSPAGGGVHPVPEPGTLALLAAAAACGLAAWRRAVSATVSKERRA